MDATIRKNERCFIAMPRCGYGYESAKLCFVAAPSDEKYTLKMEVIKEVIEAKQYECHIALRRIDPGSFSFCTKICSKIIQSQFCIILLDPSENEEGSECPNPNVHLEYGMMMSQNKHIIPLQDEKYRLAFNVSPLDTIKYTEGNFKLKVTEAVDYAIKKFSERKASGQIPQGPEVLTFYNLSGYKMSDVTLTLHKMLYEFGVHLGFFLFDSKDCSKFVGPFDFEDPKKVILHAKLLIDNIVSTYESLIATHTKEAGQGVYNYLVEKVSIDLIVSPSYKKDDIVNRIEKIATKKYSFPIEVYYRRDIARKIENEYKTIGDLEAVRPASG